VQTRAGIGDYMLPKLRGTFDRRLATALTNEQRIVAQGDNMAKSSCRFS
jgi:hypothetical protein